MALHYNATGIPSSITTSPFDEDKWHPVTHYLMFATMGIGMNEITKQNAPEFFRRIAIFQKVHGCAVQYRDHLDGTNKEIYITMEDITNHIGLHTNSSLYSKAEFNKKIFEQLERNALSSYVDDSAHKRVAEHYDRYQTYLQTPKFAA
jgi:hypothetical protein